MRDSLKPGMLISILALATVATPVPAQQLRREASAQPRPTRQLQPDRETVFYRNCAQARAAGAAPLLRGRPGYAPHLDRDGDGVACEPYFGRR